MGYLRNAFKMSIEENYCGGEGFFKTMLSWLFTIFTGGGFTGIVLSDAAQKADLKLFFTTMMGISMSYVNNMLNDIVFYAESSNEVERELEGKEKSDAEFILKILLYLMLVETVVQIALTIYAFNIINDTNSGRSILKSKRAACIFIGMVILDEIVIETVYLVLSFVLWVKLDFGNPVPLAGVLTSYVFGVVTVYVDILVICKGKDISPRREVQFGFQLRALSTLANASSDILFYLDSNSKLEQMELEVSSHARNANVIILVLVGLQFVLSLPVYFTPTFKQQNSKRVALIVDIFGSSVLEFGVLICSILVYSALSDGSLPLLVSVFASWSFGSFINWYEAGDIGGLNEDGQINQSVLQRGLSRVESITSPQKTNDVI